VRRQPSPLSTSRARLRRRPPRRSRRVRSSRVRDRETPSSASQPTSLRAAHRNRSPGAAQHSPSPELRSGSMLIPIPDLLRARRLLCVQPHYDDNDIGAGGTLARSPSRRGGALPDRDRRRGGRARSKLPTQKRVAGSRPSRSARARTRRARAAPLDYPTRASGARSRCAARWSATCAWCGRTGS
jgi:hypothetical protein